MLQLAGVVSGAGNSIKESLNDVMKHEMLTSLDDRRQQFENLRQQRLLEAQRGMHSDTITAAAEQGRLTRENATSLADKQIGSNEKLASLIDTRTRELANAEDRRVRDVEGERNKTTENVHREDRQSQERVATLTRDANVAIHEADRKLKKYEIDTTAESLTRTAASKAIVEVGNELTRLNTLLANPMLDPNGPHAKNLTDRLKRLEDLHLAYSQYLKPGATESAAPAAPAEKPAFNLGKYAPKAPASAAPPAEEKGLLNSPGIRVLPVPSEDVQKSYAPSTIEQEMMRRSIE